MEVAASTEGREKVKSSTNHTLESCGVVVVAEIKPDGLIAMADNGYSIIIQAFNWDGICPAYLLLNPNVSAVPARCLTEVEDCQRDRDQQMRNVQRTSSASVLSECS